MDKPCATCKFFDDSWGYACLHPKLRKWNLVQGWVASHPMTNRGAPGRCGFEGTHWERRVSIVGWLLKAFAIKFP